MQCDNGNYTVA